MIDGKLFSVFLALLNVASADVLVNAFLGSDDSCSLSVLSTTSYIENRCYVADLAGASGSFQWSCAGGTPTVTVFYDTTCSSSSHSKQAYANGECSALVDSVIVNYLMATCGQPSYPLQDVVFTVYDNEVPNDCTTISSQNTFIAGQCYPNNGRFHSLSFKWYGGIYPTQYLYTTTTNCTGSYSLVSWQQLGCATYNGNIYNTEIYCVSDSSSSSGLPITVIIVVVCVSVAVLLIVFIVWRKHKSDQHEPQQLQPFVLNSTVVGTSGARSPAGSKDVSGAVGQSASWREPLLINSERSE